MTYAMIDTYCASYKRPPRPVTLDIDDTLDVVHGHQQLSRFNAHYDERCFLPIHVYDNCHIAPSSRAAAHRQDAVRRGNPRPSWMQGAPDP
jgi:hypothetical protein